MDSGHRGFEEQFARTLGKKPEKSVPLKKFAHFEVGGPADYFFSASSQNDLVQSVTLARRHNIAYYVIGGGYNLLFDDAGFRGLIIKNCVRGIEETGKAKIEVCSGTPIKNLVEYCLSAALEGLEFLAGIPGTVGGAVSGNAGAFEGDIGSCLVKALILDKQGKQVPVDRDYFAFDYRRSRLKACRGILLNATFMLRKGVRRNMEKKISEYLAKRENKHPPWDVACAGSYFKNPILPGGKRKPAAFYLDRVGAKNLTIGGAAVFSGHANFIINKKEASSKDILLLARELKKRVKEEFGLDLEEVVIYIPADLPMP